MRTSIPNPLETTSPTAERPSFRSQARAFGAALRPRQWVKNLLVFAAPGAAGILGEREVFVRATLAFVALCLLSSAAYLVNDVLDGPRDRLHPVKRLRPIASGALDRRIALGGAIVLSAGGLALGAVISAPFVLVELAYVSITLAYSLFLKRIAVIDLASVAAGYVLRAIAGGIATGVAPSAWFLILAASGAWLVVAGKRLADLPLSAGEDPEARSSPTSAGYPSEYLRGVWIVACAVSIAAYCLWAFAVPHRVDGVAWSQVSIVPFALALLRYAYVIELGWGGAPEVVFSRDRVLQVLVLLWLVVYVTGVYLK